MEVNNDWIAPISALLGTVFAGAGLKLTDWWLSRSSNRQKVDSALREEYRDTISDKRKDIAELKADLENAKDEIDSLEEEVTEWREKYFSEVTARIEVVARLKQLEGKYKNE